MYNYASLYCRSKIYTVLLINVKLKNLKLNYFTTNYILTKYSYQSYSNNPLTLLFTNSTAPHSYTNFA